MDAERWGTSGCLDGAVGHTQRMQPYTPTAVAEALLSQLDGAAVRRGRASLAIPGGRSPGPVLTALARLCPSGLRSRLDLFWLDERAVPPGHPERNDAATLAAWTRGGPLPGRVYPMAAEADDLEAAAVAYAATLPSRLDACLIGVGEDGHVASLFPRHPALGDPAAVLVVSDSPKPPPRRLSIGLGPIVQAGFRAVLCLGTAKAAVWQAVQTGPDRACPASLLPRADTAWYLDDAAVAGLAGGSPRP
jgi:6-phosphogluconolactonase